MPGVTLDAGGMIALDRNDRRVVVLLARARETGARVTIPATALAQAIRRPDRQVRLARLVRQPTTDVIALDRVDATNVGRLLAASGTSDIVDAHVVICARRSEQHIVTSDPDDLRVLDPTVGLIALLQIARAQVAANTDAALTLPRGWRGGSGR
jgi:predicted nucleic acid-binding protein